MAKKLIANINEEKIPLLIAKPVNTTNVNETPIVSTEKLEGSVYTDPIVKKKLTSDNLYSKPDQKSKPVFQEINEKPGIKKTLEIVNLYEVKENNNVIDFPNLYNSDIKTVKKSIKNDNVNNSIIKKQKLKKGEDVDYDADERPRDTAIKNIAQQNQIIKPKK